MDSKSVVISSSESPFTQAQHFLEHELKAVDQLIHEKLTPKSTIIPKVTHHLMKAGGKRLRSILTLLSAKLCGYENGTRHEELATCVEFIHTATLLHDDVVDGSSHRRGKPTAHTLWGNTTSILVGDFLFSRAFELMVADGSLDVLQTLSTAATKIAQGELLQLELNGNLKATIQDYLEVIRCKTAELFHAAMSLGGIITHRSTAEIEALGKYGSYLGLIFQLVDDVLDYTAASSEFGKTVGGDFYDGKLTLPVILALSKADSLEYAFWQRTLGERTYQEGDLAKALEILNTHAISREVDQYTGLWAQEAQAALSIFPESIERTLLENLVDFLRKRSF